MTWPTGLFVRQNQPLEGSPSGELTLHSEMLGSVSASTTTSSPATRPGLLDRVAVWLPFTAFTARLVDCVNVNHWAPMVITFALVPTGIFNFVRVGPWPRRTIPLVIWSVPVILKSPAESWTTWPAGHASSAVWMPALASWDPFPYVDALIVLKMTVLAGMPPGMPGLQTVRRSLGRKSVANANLEAQPMAARKINRSFMRGEPGRRMAYLS